MSDNIILKEIAIAKPVALGLTEEELKAIGIGA